MTEKEIDYAASLIEAWQSMRPSKLERVVFTLKERLRGRDITDMRRRATSPDIYAFFHQFNYLNQRGIRESQERYPVGLVGLKLIEDVRERIKLCQ